MPPSVTASERAPRRTPLGHVHGATSNGARVKATQPAVDLQSSMSRRVYAGRKDVLAKGVPKPLFAFAGVAIATTTELSFSLLGFVCTVGACFAQALQSVLSADFKGTEIEVAVLAGTEQTGDRRGGAVGEEDENGEGDQQERRRQRKSGELRGAEVPTTATTAAAREIRGLAPNFTITRQAKSPSRCKLKYRHGAS